MKLPSLDHIYKKATITLRRFPFTLCSSVLISGIFIYLVQISYHLNSHTQTVLAKIEICGVLGISLFTALTVFSEHKRQHRLGWWGLHLLGLLLIIAYYFTLPVSFDEPNYVIFYRYVLFFIGTHLLVAIALGWRKSTTQAFWQYNKLLFLRFLTALLFSVVLYAGLSVALLAIHALFSVTIKYKWYEQLFAIIGGIFNTWFFLAGIPTSLKVFEAHSSYPKGLKIFTQNVLLPLVVIYLAILYLYIMKIIVQWSWPEGWVAILVLSFSIVGILAILLLYPIRDRAEHTWINRFYTGFFAALIPLIIMLMLAIYRRVADYGVTIERYFVIVLSLWLAGIVIYFLFSHARNIKIIPTSLCVLAFVISFGPWSAFSVSRRSQVNRLEYYLNQNNILQGGTIHKASSAISKGDRIQITSILDYLNKTNDLKAIQPWFQKSLFQTTITTSGKDSVTTLSHYQRRRRALTLMGINRNFSASSHDRKYRSYSVYPKQKDVFEVNDGQWFIHDVQWSSYAAINETFAVDDDSLVIKSFKQDPKLHIYYTDKLQQALRFNMVDIVHQLQDRLSPDQHQLPAKKLRFPLTNNNFRGTLYIQKLSWSTVNDSLRRVNGALSIVLKLRKKD